MQGIGKQNCCIKYFLPEIEIFCKFAWEISVYSKDSKATTAAVEQVLIAANPRHFQCLHIDKGKEFFNSKFQGLMKRRGI